jgi:hypothetical protein
VFRVSMTGAGSGRFRVPPRKDPAPCAIERRRGVPELLGQDARGARSELQYREREPAVADLHAQAHDGRGICEI